MKKLLFITLTIVIGLGIWGSLVVVYANTPRNGTLAIVATPTASPTPKTITDFTATIGVGIRKSVFSHGSSSLKEIALTFDDGPSPAYTAQVLSILQQHSVKATFFCIGEQVQQYPNLVQQEHQSGNVVGNHSWDHSNLTTLSQQEVQYQLDTTSTSIKQATGVQPTVFRPPYGAINESVKNEATHRDLTPVLWNVDTEDWQQPGVSAIVKTVLDNASNGSVILLHDGGGDRSQTVAALPEIIAALQERGFKFVTIPQLIADSGDQASNDQV